jgi:hypothetical protein
MGCCQNTEPFSQFVSLGTENVWSLLIMSSMMMGSVDG